MDSLGVLPFRSLVVCCIPQLFFFFSYISKPVLRACVDTDVGWWRSAYSSGQPPFLLTYLPGFGFLVVLDPQPLSLLFWQLLYAFRNIFSLFSILSVSFPLPWKFREYSSTFCQKQKSFYSVFNIKSSFQVFQFGLACKWMVF